MKHVCVLSKAAILSALVAGFLYGQAPTASIVGVVRDTSGAAVPGAVVEVVNRSTNEQRSAVTSGTGEFNIVGMLPGEYDLTGHHEGFRSIRRSNLVLQIDQAARVEIELPVGQVQESVEVVAEAPLVNTESAVRGDVITPKEISEMPLAGRDFSNLLVLAPGVQANSAGSSGAAVMGGMRGDNNNFLTDGFNVQNPATGGMQTRPPLDAMEEFKVQVANYSAEYGRLAGGVVNMALKSGGNKYRGSLFEYFRNDDLDARNFFDQGKSKLRLNQFGMELDGPVRVPKLYNGKDRTFFVVSWERTRENDGSAQLSVVPTPLQRAGNFSQTLTAKGVPETVKDPLSGAAFPGGIIPANRINSIAQNVLPYFPLPNLSSGANNYYAGRNAWTDQDRLLVKVDQRITSRQNFAYRYMRKGLDQSLPFNGTSLGTSGLTVTFPEALHGFSYTYSISPTLLFDARVGFVHSFVEEFSINSTKDWNAALGIPYTPSAAVVYGFPRFTIRGFAPLGDGAGTPQDIRFGHWDLGSAVTKIHGRQIIKFGFEAGKVRHQQLAVNNSRGTFDFLGNFSGDPFADFLLGYLNDASRQVGFLENDFRYHWYGLFVQDDFKVSSKLTLNFGLRWELLPPATDGAGKLGGWVSSLGKVIIADDRNLPSWKDLVAQAGLTNYYGLARDYGLPQSIASTNYRDFGPRLGFAWRPFGGTRTVIRSGYGLYYSSSATNALRAQLAAVFPFADNQSFTAQPNNPNSLVLTNPFPTALAQLTGTTNVSGLELNPKPQTVQNWNFTVEHEILPGLAIEAAYTGTKGTHLSRTYNINQPIESASARLPNGQLARPVSAFTTINQFVYNASSTYNASIFSVRKRFGRAGMLRANYMFGKSLDDSSALSGASTGGFPGAQDVRNLRLEKGRSDWDARHVFSANFVYPIPAPQNFLLKGWQVAGAVLASSGMPLTPRVTANANIGDASRPNRTAFGSLANPTPQDWFDLAAFPLVPSGSLLFGNSGRGILDGPGNFSTNLSLSRRFNVADRGFFQLRWEAYNALNRTNFGVPNTVVNTPTAGVIASAAAARTMQLALKYVF